MKKIVYFILFYLVIFCGVVFGQCDKITPEDMMRTGHSLNEIRKQIQNAENSGYVIDKALEQLKNLCEITNKMIETKERKYLIKFQDEFLNFSLVPLLRKVGQPVPDKSELLYKFDKLFVIAYNTIRAIRDQPDTVYGVPDYWQTPKETLSKMLGDCEDHALLFSYIMGASELHGFFVLGQIEESSGKIQLHAYNIVKGNGGISYIIENDDRLIPIFSENGYLGSYYTAHVVIPNRVITSAFETGKKIEWKEFSTYIVTIPKPYIFEAFRELNDVIKREFEERW